MESDIGYFIFFIVLAFSIFSFITRKNKIEKLNSLLLAIGITILIFDLFKPDFRLIKLESLILVFLLGHFLLSRFNFFKTHLFSFLSVSISSLIFLFIGEKTFEFMGAPISFLTWNIMILPLFGASIWYLAEISATISSQFVGFETKKSLKQVNHLFFFALAIIIASFVGTPFGVFLVGISYLSSSFYRNDNSSNIAFAFLLLSMTSFFLQKFALETLDLIVIKNITGLCLGIAGVWYLQILSKSKSNALPLSLIGFVFHMFFVFLLLIIYNQKSALGGMDAFISLLIGTSIGLASFNNFSLTHLLFSSLLLLGLSIGPYTINTEAVNQENNLYKGLDTRSKDKKEKKSVFDIKGFALNDIIGEYKIDDANSLLSFKLGQKGDVTEGAINSFFGRISIIEGIIDSKFTVVLPVDNLTTYNELRDESLMDANYFNRAKYSKMKFTASNLIERSDYYELQGEFVLLGVKKPLLIQIKYIGQETINGKKRPIIVGKSSVDRTKYGMTSSALEGNIVDFEFRIELIKI